MSTFCVPVVVIEEITKHPNADTLSVTTVDGCPVIFRTGDFQTGDLALYLPVDAVINNSETWVQERLAFLKFNASGAHRVRAKCLRGVFSMGILVQGMPWKGATLDVSAELHVAKYEEPEPVKMGGENEQDPGICPVYDMESYRKYKSVLIPGDEVVVTEKRHGTSARFVYHEGQLYVGSHRCFKKGTISNVWWRTAIEHNLEQKLIKYPDLAVYGEIFGWVQDLRYDAKPGELKFEVFDIYDTKTRAWGDWDQVLGFCEKENLPVVPVLYRGTYDPDVIEPLANGNSTTASCIREGFVIKPTSNKWDATIGRVILKLVSEGYLLRKDGTEHH